MDHQDHHTTPMQDWYLFNIIQNLQERGKCTVVNCFDAFMFFGEMSCFLGNLSFLTTEKNVLIIFIFKYDILRTT